MVFMALFAIGQVAGLIMFVQLIRAIRACAGRIETIDAACDESFDDMDDKFENVNANYAALSVEIGGDVDQVRNEVATLRAELAALHSQLEAIRPAPRVTLGELTP